MSLGPNEADPPAPRMDPAILIFLLYLMILHELVSGWMEYKKQVTKPKKKSGPLWSSRHMDTSSQAYEAAKNVSNSTECQLQKSHLAIPLLIGILSVGCLVFNSISLWIFWFKLKRWNSSIMLQFNLALVDASILPITPLMVAYFILGNHWPFGEFLCQFQAFMLGTHLYGSIYFLMLISVHRYQAIVHYSAKSLWRKKTFWKKLIWVFWVLLFLQGLLFFFLIKTLDLDGSRRCLTTYRSELSHVFLIYSIVLMVLCFLLPFCISMASYVMLGAYIAQISKATLQGRVIKTKSIQMITVALVIFAICFMPYHICSTLATILKHYGMPCESLRHIEISYYVSLVFTMVNCCLDPFIYNFANENFNRSFSRTLRRFFSSKQRKCASGKDQ
ncbi:PREDICTED: P2Y purinoceptor 2-like [Gekko japonicus]|uniref:P2Y purinoceptor 2-like n=1 Tax=Gekko japonicus TaxID=146911 RepID=A0ABM1KSE9_GEKJA|nr:PREDICTED: P2Y purinoceptor 2-like [Gekko japonicus]